jgi:hypothetical protein
LSWDELEAKGLGALRLTPSALYDMTFDELGNAIAGFYELEEQRQRQEWERTRWLAMLTITPHVKKGSIKNATDIARFPWEQEKKPATDGLAILRQMASNG